VDAGLGQTRGFGFAAGLGFVIGWAVLTASTDTDGVETATIPDAEGVGTVFVTGAEQAASTPAARTTPQGCIVRRVRSSRPGDRKSSIREPNG
jgi:hypothetical protein